jgi:aryl-alcohol dehydrogenase-like predicted oxidoreductase
VDEGQVIEGLAEALSQGCNFFDTADCYGHGHSEVLLGKAVRNVRNRVLIATKAGSDFYHGPEHFNFEPSYLRFALHQSLRRLNTDYIDIYQLHNPPVEVLYQHAVIDELRAMQFSGKVRWLGVSVQGIDDGLHVINAGWPDTVQLPYNLLSPQGLNIIHACATRHIGVIVREALANGMLTDGFGQHKRYPEGDIRSFWPPEMIQFFADRVDTLRPFARPNESLAQLAIRLVLVFGTMMKRAAQSG